jgi:hypothetical protein
VGSSLPALQASSAGVAVTARVAAALVAAGMVAVVAVGVAVAALVAVGAAVVAGDVKSFANRECF